MKYITTSLCHRPQYADRLRFTTAHSRGNAHHSVLTVHGVKTSRLILKIIENQTCMVYVEVTGNVWVT